MRKLFAFIMVNLLLLGIVGCGNGETAEPEEETREEAPPQEMEEA